MVTAPYAPKETAEVTIAVPVVRRRLEPAEVTWLRDAEGWVWIRVNGEETVALGPELARRLAEDIVYGAPAPEADPVPEV